MSRASLVTGIKFWTSSGDERGPADGVVEGLGRGLDSLQMVKYTLCSTPFWFDGHQAQVDCTLVMMLVP